MALLTGRSGRKHCSQGELLDPIVPVGGVGRFGNQFQIYNQLAGPGT